MSDLILTTIIICATLVMLALIFYSLLRVAMEMRTRVSLQDEFLNQVFNKSGLNEECERIKKEFEKENKEEK